MRRTAWGLALALGWAGTAQAVEMRGAARVAAAGEQRVALVVGNKDYADKPLKNAVNDARDMKAALEKLGFAVVYRENADLAEMDAAMHEFTGKLGQGGVGLFYFAGHGMAADETNYLLPVGVPIASKAELKARGYDARIALDSMEEAKARVSVVILDACRTALLRGGSGGLAEMGGGAGSIIAFATAPKQTAEDGSGRNGTFTKNLLAHIAEPGITALQALEKTQTDVAEETRDTQQPWINHGPLRGQFCFAGCAEAGESDAEAKLRAAQERIRELETVKPAITPKLSENPAAKPSPPTTTNPQPSAPKTKLTVALEYNGKPFDPGIVSAFKNRLENKPHLLGGQRDIRIIIDDVSQDTISYIKLEATVNVEETINGETQRNSFGKHRDGFYSYLGLARTKEKLTRELLDDVADEINAARN